MVDALHVIIPQGSELPPGGLTTSPTKPVHLFRQHMEGSSKPKHFFAAGCVFADFAIAVIFNL